MRPSASARYPRIRATFAAGAFLLALCCAGLANAAGTPPATACKSTVSGDLHLHTLKSSIFGNERTIRVLLPAGYGDAGNKDRRYPVLYMLDGQNVFDACLSDVSHHEWSVDETVQKLIADKKVPPMIVVGVDHAEREPDRGPLLPGEHDAGLGDGGQHAVDFRHDFAQVKRLGEHLGLFGRAGRAAYLTGLYYAP